MDNEKSKELILILEDAQLKLKLLIRDDIILNVDTNITKQRYLELERNTKLKLEEAGADEQFINENLSAFKLTFMTWYSQIFKNMEKLKEELIKQGLPILEVVSNEEKKTGGMIIGDSGLKRAEVKNIREFMTIYEDGSAGYYYNYAQKVDEIIGQLKDQNVVIGNRSVRAVAELKARYDAINGDLQKIKDKGIKFVASTSHANASERCQWWQGKIFIIDDGFDIMTREMGQYKGQKPKQTIKGYIDGKPYYSLKEACENGFLSYNCQHRLVAYYKGIHLQQYNLVDIKKKRNIASGQRYLERRIRNVRTELALTLDPVKQKELKSKIREMNKGYKQYCKDNNVGIFDWRTKLTPNEYKKDLA